LSGETSSATRPIGLIFLQRLEKLIPETGIVCYGWAFLPNHALFLFIDWLRRQL